MALFPNQSGAFNSGVLKAPASCPDKGQIAIETSNPGGFESREIPWLSLLALYEGGKVLSFHDYNLGFNPYATIL